MSCDSIEKIYIVSNRIGCARCFSHFRGFFHMFECPENLMAVKPASVSAQPLWWNDLSLSVSTSATLHRHDYSVHVVGGRMIVKIRNIRTRLREESRKMKNPAGDLSECRFRRYQPDVSDLSLQ